MKILGMTIETKVTLGQVVSVVIFVLGITYLAGQMSTKLSAMETDVKSLKDSSVTQEQLKASIESIDKNISVITQLVITHVANLTTLAPQASRVGSSVKSRQFGSRNTDSLHTNIPH